MIKRLFSLLFSFMTFFMTACSSPAQKTDSIYKETTKEAVSVIFEETRTIKSDETAVKENSTTTTRKTESTSKNTISNSSNTTATNVTNKNETTNKPFVSNKVTTTKEITTKVTPTTSRATTGIETTKKTETTTSSLNLPDYYPGAEMIALYNSINDYRVENNLNKLSLDSELCKLAYIRAKEQEVSEGHIRPDGSRFFSVLDEYNYSYITSGENIVLIWNNPSTRSLELWKNSETHNENMLKSKWTKTGIAMYQNSDGRYNIVQLFAH